MQYNDEQFEDGYTEEHQVTTTTSQHVQHVRRPAGFPPHQQHGYSSGHQMQMLGPFQGQTAMAAGQWAMPAQQQTRHLEQQMYQHGAAGQWTVPQQPTRYLDQQTHQHDDQRGQQLPQRLYQSDSTLDRQVSQHQRHRADRQEEDEAHMMHTKRKHYGLDSDSYESDEAMSRRTSRNANDKSKNTHRDHHQHSSRAEPPRASHNQERRSDGARGIVHQSGFSHYSESRSQHDNSLGRRATEDDQHAARRTANTSKSSLSTFRDLQSMLSSGQLEHVYGSYRVLQRTLERRAGSRTLDPRNFPSFDPAMVPPAILPGTPLPLYPEMPEDAFTSVCRDLALKTSGRDGAAQHDQMVLSIFGHGCMACPANLPWSVCSRGYNCIGNAHFIPHSEIDMMLAGARPHGPYIWTRDLQLWGLSKDLVPLYQVYLPGKLESIRQTFGSHIYDY